MQKQASWPEETPERLTETGRLAFWTSGAREMLPGMGVAGTSPGWRPGVQGMRRAVHAGTGWRLVMTMGTENGPFWTVGQRGSPATETAMQGLQGGQGGTLTQIFSSQTGWPSDSP